jgi:ATP-dependent Clp protease ATP-binding subunit ClpA
VVFERFTREARQVVISAVEEADRRGDSRVGTDHLLVVIAQARSLAGIFPSPDEIRAQIDRLDEEALRAVGLDPGLNDHERPSLGRGKHIPFTGASREALKRALKEAVAWGHRHIGVEHIALALVTGEPPDRALAIIDGLGLSADAIRTSLVRRFEKAS